MKRSKWLTLLLVMMLAAMFVVGCPEDDDDDDGNNNPTGPTGDLTADELTDAQLTQATEFGMVGTAQSGIQSAVGMKAGMMNGFVFAPNSIEQSGVVKPWFSISDPPEGWTGPDGSGWYTHAGDDFWDEYGVRFTPDVWSSEHADEDPTKIEQYMTSLLEEAMYSTELTVSMWAQVNAERTLMDGGWSSMTSTSYGDYDIDFDFEYSCTWTDVSLVEGNYSGHFETLTLYPIYGQDLMPQFVAMETSITFIADGSGDGVGTIAGEEYVRFTFNPYANQMIEGFYTLKSEDWEVEHPITLYVY